MSGNKKENQLPQLSPPNEDTYEVSACDSDETQTTEEHLITLMRSACNELRDYAAISVQIDSAVNMNIDKLDKLLEKEEEQKRTLEQNGQHLRNAWKPHQRD